MARGNYFVLFCDVFIGHDFTNHARRHRPWIFVVCKYIKGDNPQQVLLASLVSILTAQLV